MCSLFPAKVFLLYLLATAAHYSILGWTKKPSIITLLLFLSAETNIYNFHFDKEHFPLYGVFSSPFTVFMALLQTLSNFQHSIRHYFINASLLLGKAFPLFQPLIHVPSLPILRVHVITLKNKFDQMKANMLYK